jgi:diguanylate cyclase (GGDEF)-like protein
MTIVNLLTTGSVMMFVWNVDRPGPGLTQMALGVLLAGFGLLASALRNVIPGDAAILLSNLVVVAGSILLLIGVRAFRGFRAVPGTLIACFAAVYTGAIAHWLFVENDPSARVAIASVTLAVLSVMKAGAMLLDLPQEDRRIYVFSAVLFSLHAVALGLRAAWAVTHRLGNGILAGSPPDLTSLFTLNFVVTGCCVAVATASSRKLYHSTRKLALHDPLTQLPNRRMFEDRIAELRKAGSQSSVALVYLDLDNFKAINDMFGHSGGDEVLCVIGQRLISEFAGAGFPARLGGDEFIVLVENVKSRPAAFAVMEKMIRAIQAQMMIGNQSVYIEVSGGMALYPEDAASLTELADVADRCMYRSKRRHEQFSSFANHIPRSTFAPSPKTIA